MKKVMVEKSGFEVTPLGWLLIVLAIAALCFAGRHALADVYASVLPSTGGQGASARTPKGTPGGASGVITAKPKDKAAVGTIEGALPDEAAARPVERDGNADALKAALDRANKDRASTAAAAKAVYDEQHRQLTELEVGLKNLSARVATLPTATPQQRVAKEDAAATVQGMQRLAQTVKNKQIDISNLPIEYVTVQSSGLTALAKDSVSLGSQRFAVGQKLPTGETIMGIDPESRAVVTDRRIINVTG